METDIGPKYNFVSAEPVERQIPIIQSIGLDWGPSSARKLEMLGGAGHPTGERLLINEHLVLHLWCRVEVSH